MPTDDLSELRKRVQRWCLLVHQMTDAGAVEALHVEIARLMEQISRLEARGNRSDSLRGHDHS
ncbi:MAG: hypothetical protein ACJ8AW_03050 [Rhodopila sp.]